MEVAGLEIAITELETHRQRARDHKFRAGQQMKTDARASFAVENPVATRVSAHPGARVENWAGPDGSKGGEAAKELVVPADQDRHFHG